MNLNKVFIIAEAGVNHNGDINLAYKLIDAAKESGADAIKFQTFKSESLVSKSANMAEYQEKNMNTKISQYDMLKKLELSQNEFILLKNYCDKIGIQFLSSPFDIESIDFLENLVDLYKVPSGEIINYQYLRYMVNKNKPIIMSTGMSTLEEVKNAVNIIKTQNPKIELFLLHCTTNYPTQFDEVNLNAMLTLKKEFNLIVGYSDHTTGIEVPIAAVAMGAKIIEKHFTLDKKLSGPDHKASLEPNEFKNMVSCIRNVELSLGDGIKKPTNNELKIMLNVRKSIFAYNNLNVDDIITEQNIIIKRPATGISPKDLDLVLGKRIKKNILKDAPLLWEYFK